MDTCGSESGPSRPAIAHTKQDKYRVVSAIFGALSSQGVVGGEAYGTRGQGTSSCGSSDIDTLETAVADSEGPKLDRQPHSQLQEDGNPNLAFNCSHGQAFVKRATRPQ